MGLFGKTNKQPSEYEELCERFKDVSSQVRLAEQDERLAVGDYVEIAIQKTNSLRALRNQLFQDIKKYERKEQVTA